MNILRTRESGLHSSPPSIKPIFTSQPKFPPLVRRGAHDSPTDLKNGILPERSGSAIISSGHITRDILAMEFN